MPSFINIYMRLIKHINDTDQYISEKVTQSQLDNLERVLDRLYKSLSIDIEFSRHFLARVNDKRNKKDITIPELKQLFSKTYSRYGTQFKDYGDGMQAVLNDIQTDINIPFVLRWNPKSKMIELVSKTVMRKKGFQTSSPKLPV
ncbi:MAG: hypothetical protein KAS32_22865 [Candidatus Peribacteraceae bacterium]|nr:hypothetical protein [Candidatus Peribacteraceae bacterium]